VAPRSVGSYLFKPLEAFLALEGSSGIVLLASAAIALLWANSPLAGLYQLVWETPFPITGESLHAPTARFLINDGLMTLFFFVVGLEIKRELHSGELRSARAALLPLAAAAGGILVPAAMYLAISSESDTLRAGWAIPTATDIAFALAVLLALGSRVPNALRVLLLSVAIIDDIAAVVIIAVVYSGGLSLTALLVALAAVAGVLAMQRCRVSAFWPYVLAGLALWVGLLVGGIHPTIAGVTLGLLAPVVAPRDGATWSPVETLERLLHPWVAFGVMPLFALANAGVTVNGERLNGGEPSVLVIAIVAALVLGKPLGIVAGAAAVVKTGLADLPVGVTWRGVGLIGCLGAIGFTMSIFIATLAFGTEELLEAAKVGVLIASVFAGVCGIVLGRFLLAPKA
jgi:NhaA family Na+:H+ antiporter